MVRNGDEYVIEYEYVIVMNMSLWCHDDTTMICDDKWYENDMVWYPGIQTSLHGPTFHATPISIYALCSNVELDHILWK